MTEPMPVCLGVLEGFNIGQACHQSLPRPWVDVLEFEGQTLIAVIISPVSG